MNAQEMSSLMFVQLDLVRFVAMAAVFLAVSGGLISLSAWASALDNLAKPTEGRSMRQSSTYRVGPGGERDPKGEPKGDYEELSNRDNYRVAPGDTHVLLDVEGPGVITHIWMTFLGPEPHPWAPDGAANHQELLLRMYWDDHDHPAVEAPVGDFFACGFGQRCEVISQPVVVEGGDSYNCFWHMPFRASARMEIINQSEKELSLLYYNIDWIKKESVPEDTPYFHAQYRQEYPVRNGEDYLLLDTRGRGHYVGTVLNVRTRSPEWFGEGDEKIYIDGEAKPSIWGTGTEDYFLSAWGLRKMGTPYFGVPQFVDGTWGLVGCRMSAYRWHIADPVVFNTGIRVALEHFGWMSPDENPNYERNSWNEREDDFSSVAFWYQQGPSTFEARAPHARERALPELDSIFRPQLDASSVAHGTGDAVRQDLGIYHPTGHLLYMPPAQENAWVEVPIQVERRAPLRLLLNMTHSYDFGIYEASLDGVKLGDRMDFYSNEIETREHHLLDFWPEPGTYTLRLECVGKNHLSEGHYLGLESVRLRERRPRVRDYAHDKEKDWRKDPVCYR